MLPLSTIPDSKSASTPLTFFELTWHSGQPGARCNDLRVCVWGLWSTNIFVKLSIAFVAIDNLPGLKPLCAFHSSWCCHLLSICFLTSIWLRPAVHAGYAKWGRRDIIGSPICEFGTHGKSTDIAYIAKKPGKASCWASACDMPLRATSVAYSVKGWVLTALLAGCATTFAVPNFRTNRLNAHKLTKLFLIIDRMLVAKPAQNNRLGQRSRIVWRLVQSTMRARYRMLLALLR
jgi:hypothetical protein